MCIWDYSTGIIDIPMVEDVVGNRYRVRLKTALAYSKHSFDRKQSASVKGLKQIFMEIISVKSGGAVVSAMHGLFHSCCVCGIIQKASLT